MVQRSRAVLRIEPAENLGAQIVTIYGDRNEITRLCNQASDSKLPGDALYPRAGVSTGNDAPDAKQLYRGSMARDPGTAKQNERWVCASHMAANQVQLGQ